MTQVNTPILKFDHEETPVHLNIELPSWDTIKCQRHPQFKVDALNIDEDYYDDDTKLLCIKCILEGDYLSATNGKKIITIKELMQKCSESLKTTTSINEEPKGGLDDIFLDFLTQDYIGTYERHLESQYQIVDQEIKGVIENLTKLKDKYKDYYAEELVDVRVKAEDIKKKIRKYLDENSGGESPSLSSVQQMLQQYNSVKTADEFCRFLKEIHRKSKETTQSAANHFDSHTQTLQIMEEFKAKASNLEEKAADLHYLQEMDRTVRILLRSGTMMFKKQKGVGVLTNTMKLPEALPIKLEQPSWNTLKLGTYASSPSEDQPISLSCFENYRNSDNMINRKRNRTRFLDIDSQSLRNLKKEIDEKENADPNCGLSYNREKAVSSLNDWINRRITGYLIFQNTVNNDPEVVKDKANSSELGVHLNHVIGHKWKSLTKEEKEQYKALAKEYRKMFRGEIDEFKQNGDLDQLLESLDCKIKKIKRE